MKACCKEPKNRHFHSISGILLYTEVRKKKTYSFRCAACGAHHTTTIKPEPPVTMFTRSRT